MSISFTRLGPEFKNGIATHIFTVLLLLLCLPGHGQERFVNQGQIWQIMRDIDVLVELKADSITGILKIDTLTKELPERLECLAYRHTDGLLYALHATDRTLYTVDAKGVIREVATLDIDPAKVYVAGDITPDGRYFTVIGSDGVRDLLAVTVDLESQSYAAVNKNISTSGLSADIAYHPYSGELYGYDEANHAFTLVDLQAGKEVLVADLPENGEVGGVYFTPFGELRGFGTTQFGVASAIYGVDPETGSVTIVNSGGVYNPRDMATNSATIGLRLRVAPGVAFPCEEVVFSLVLANSTGVDVDIAEIKGGVSHGIELLGVLRNKFGREMYIDVDGKAVEMGGFTLKVGMDSILIRAAVGDIPEGRYRTQLEMKGLSQELGYLRISDDPESRADSDSTAVRVERIEDDSVYLKRFFCLGEDIVLDASDYGNNIKWWNGSSQTEITVNSAGMYSFEASTGCNTVVGTFEVTVAQCPFTIELTHDIHPRLTFPCSEVLFTYIIENDAGIVQNDLAFTDTLLPGFEFIEVVKSTFEGIVMNSGSPEVLLIKDLTLGVGYDTLSVRVFVGNVTPDNYGNRAILFGLPSDVGTHRVSDDPTTLAIDSTYMEVLGVDRDSLFLDVDMCNGQPVILDATRFGVSFVWDNGLESAFREVYQPGRYGVTVFDGCDESYVTFEVVRAPGIQIYADSTFFRSRLSDVLIFSPWISNEGDTLVLEWSDPADTSLSCHDCAMPSSVATDDIHYRLVASNEICSDSIEYVVSVDKSRRLYVPNIFSPNGDGINDRLTISSPDYGLIEEMAVRDRWGAVVHISRDIVIDSGSAGWDGRVGGQFVASGVYTWNARIRFFDGEVEWFAGQVTVLR